MMIGFKSSINTKFDIGKTEIFENYIPTTSHVSPINEILTSAQSISTKNSHLIIGPYGTGKSYLTTLLSSLLSKKYQVKDYDLLFDKFNQLGEYPTTCKLLNSIKDYPITYIPVLLNGDEGNFREAIITNMYRYITLYDDKIALPGIPSTIKATILRWKEHFPASYKKFKSSISISEKEFLENISNHNQESISIFNDIYRNITSGATLQIDTDTSNFIQLSEEILKILKEKKLGLLIAYDEFGRFLQTLSREEINRTMQDIQDLAELANNGSENLEIMLISHKNLNSYFANFDEELRAEFNRIEGRFSSHTIRSDQNVFAALIKDFIVKLDLSKKITPTLIDTYESSLRFYNLFNDLTPIASKKLVIEGCYPLHPISLYLLSILSNIYGQNERTLFTFLESKESGGFISFLESKEKILYPYYLFDYFFSQNEYDIVNDFKINLMIKNRDLISHDYKDNIYLNIYTFISLWELAGLNEKQKLTTNFIAFSINQDREIIEQILLELASSRFLRFNYRIERWETFQGSSIDIEKQIGKRIEISTYSNANTLDIMMSLVPSKYVKAVEYNENKQMTRFAEVKIAIIENLKEDIKKLALNKPNADLNITYLIFDNTITSIKNAMEYIKTYSSSNVIFCVTPLVIKTLEIHTKRIHALKLLLNDDEFLSLDSNLKLEIEFLLDEANYALETSMKPILDFSQDNHWVYKKDELSITNYFSLQKELSRIITSLYPKTPIFPNDLFNRKNITGVQRNASINLINKILSNEECDGSGPDYLIYYSVFKRNNYDYALNSDNRCSPLFSLKQDILKCLKKSISLNDVIEVFISEKYGYGLRAPLIPVLFTGLLSDEWDNLLFFNKNSYLMELEGKSIADMFNNPEGITFKYHTYTKKQIEIMDNILDNFTTRDEDLKKPKHIKSANAIYFWLKSLPRYAQISFDITNELIKFRDSINYLSIDPIVALEQLHGLGKNHLKELKADLENFVFKKKKELVYSAFKECSIIDLTALKEIINNSDQLVKITNPVAQIALSAIDDITFLDECSDKLIGIDIESWSDNTVEVFKKEILKYLFKIINNEFDVKDGIVIDFNGEKKIVNKVNSLSVQASNLLQRLEAMVTAQNQRVAQDEINYILYILAEKSIK